MIKKKEEVTVKKVVLETTSHVLKRCIDFGFWVCVAFFTFESIPIIWSIFIDYVINAPTSEKAVLAVIGIT
jgi:hypothetical protein